MAGIKSSTAVIRAFEGAKVKAEAKLSVDVRGIAQPADKAGITNSGGCDVTARE
jgi:hypothetical protein